jgi:hypothetical protein
MRRGVLPLTLRSGLADAGQIRSQVPLPETADELCAVARDLGGSDKDIWLGKRATEAEIKHLSEAGLPRRLPSTGYNIMKAMLLCCVQIKARLLIFGHRNYGENAFVVGS